VSDAAEHIAVWEAAGLIDQTTADRLREAAQHAVGPTDRTRLDEGPRAALSSRTSGLFGPPVAIAEAFGYLGTAFLVAAWFTWIGNLASNTDQPWSVLGIGSGAAAVALTALGAVLHRGDERRRRAAGVAFLVALPTAGAAASSLVSGAGVGWPDLAVIGSAVALAVSLGLRAYQPAVLTQIGLLSAFTAFAGASLAWFEQAIFPNSSFSQSSLAVSTEPDPILLVVGSAAWWLSLAVVIGLIGLVESSNAERSADPAAGRRAGVSRLWAGLVAILGLASAVSRSDYIAGGSYGRVLEPWIGDLGLLLVAAVLIERAFRRETNAYIYAAALGLVIAMSDLNFAYLSSGIESALLVEGLILLAAGVAADRLRRRIRRQQDPSSGPASRVPDTEGLDRGGADDSPADAPALGPTDP
jgi:hypothetical protein